MKYIVALVFVLLFNSCSKLEVIKSNTYLITIKTDKIKFNDYGFVKHTSKSVILELYEAGMLLKQIKVYDDEICVEEGCVSQQRFYKEFFNSKDYPDQILNNIINHHEILDGLDRVQTADGFEQIIKNDKYNLIYKVSKNSVYFKDRKRKNLIKIKVVQ